MNEQEAAAQMKDRLIIHLLNKLGGTVMVSFDEIFSGSTGTMLVYVDQEQQELIFTTEQLK